MHAMPFDRDEHAMPFPSLQPALPVGRGRLSATTSRAQCERMSGAPADLCAAIVDDQAVAGFLSPLAATQSGGNTGAADNPCAAADTSDETMPAGARSVLVVDDNEDAAAILAEVFQLSGHTVRVAHDSAQALQAVRAAIPDVVFLDIGLPGMDGYALARILRQECGGASMVLVALTGYGQPEDRRQSAEAGFDHHLVKPAPIDEMIRIVASLERPWPARASRSVKAGQ